VVFWVQKRKEKCLFQGWTLLYFGGINKVFVGGHFPESDHKNVFESGPVGILRETTVGVIWEEFSSRRRRRRPATLTADSDTYFARLSPANCKSHRSLRTYFPFENSFRASTLINLSISRKFEQLVRKIGCS